MQQYAARACPVAECGVGSSRLPAFDRLTQQAISACAQQGLCNFQ